MSRGNRATRNSRFRKRMRKGFKPVLSEGDSWFDYPMYKNMIDIIEDKTPFAFHRLEESGDTIHNMISNRENFKSLIEEVKNINPLFMLFSGGGNDLADKAPDLFLNDSTGIPENSINNDEFEKLLDFLEDNYRSLIEDIGKYTPIFAHGYDYFKPSNIPVKFFILEITGPWIYKEMTACEINDEALQMNIAKLMVDRYNNRLSILQDDYPDSFVYIDLRGALDTDTDWQNEIHPTREGFRKVANKFMDSLSTNLSDILKRRLDKEFNR